MPRRKWGRPWLQCSATSGAGLTRSHGRLGHPWLPVGRGSFVFQAREAAGENDGRKGRFLQGGGGVFSWTQSHCVDGLG